MKLTFLRWLPVILTVALCASLNADPITDADDMIKHRQYDNAVTYLKDKIQKDPSFADLYYQLGKALYLKGDYEQAKTELQNCLDRKRNHEDAKAYLALTYIEMKKWDDAKQILDEGTVKSKTRKGLFFDILGHYHLARKEFTEADLAFRRAIIEEPNNLEYQRDLADLAFEDKVYEVAIQGYKAILAVDSTDVTTHFRLAKALYFQQKWSEALKALGNAIRVDSSYTDAYQLSGDVYMILGLAASNTNGDNGAGNGHASDFFKTAIWMYERMLKLGGKETLDVDYRLGQAYYNINGFSLAAEYLDKAIATGSAKANAYALKAKALFRLKQYDQAEAAFGDYEKKVTKGDTNYHWSSGDFDYFRERAQTYFQLYSEGKKEGQADSSLLEKAEPFYLKAIQLKDTTLAPETGLFDQLGLCYYYTGRYQEAIPWFERKLAKDSLAVKTLQNLANCYMKLNNPEKAMEYFEKVTQINPGACSIYGTMFSYYFQERKDRKGAATAAQKWAQCDTIGYQGYKWLAFLAISDKPPRKDEAIENLRKAFKRMEAAGVDLCKEIDMLTWMSQAHNMYPEEDEARRKQAVDWAKRGLKCDPKNETLKVVIDDNE